MDFFAFSMFMFIAAFLCFMFDEFASPFGKAGLFWSLMGAGFRFLGICSFFVWLVSLGVAAGQ